MVNLNKNNDALSENLQQLGIAIPKVLLPRQDIDLSLWSVVACDQYTSDHAYWNRVEATVAKAPSTLRITLPEIFLESPDVESRIGLIHSTMKSYLEQDVLRDVGELIIFIERRTQASGLRQGLLFAMDLERYDYARDSRTLIRATEGTIVERIPPRLRVRKEATIELPHIMILVDDPQKRLIETAAANLRNKRKLYDVSLMEHGGNLCGWAIEDKGSISEIIGILSDMLADAKRNQKTDSPLFYAMGDGNHSLATAKAHWEEQKRLFRLEGIPEETIMSHPARYALAEIVNIHSSGLHFEPIHRAIFCSDPHGLAEFIRYHQLIKKATPADESYVKSLLTSADGQTHAVLYDGKQFFVLDFSDPASKLPPAVIDELFSLWNATRDVKARIDFIHGWEDTRKLTKDGAVVFFVPVIARERLFGWVAAHGPLPRKAFSMGEAEEKKYYMESRRIK